MKMNFTKNFTQNMSHVKSHERVIDTPTQHHKLKMNAMPLIQTDADSEKYKVEASVTKINDFMEPVIADIKFVFHEDLHEYYVTVVNPLTNEVIREIPPKKMLDMYAAMTEYMGLLVDEKI